MNYTTSLLIMALVIMGGLYFSPVVGLIMICIAFRALTSDVKTVRSEYGNTYKMNRCKCGREKNLNQTVCYECGHFDRCECGELKTKEQSFCGACLMELRHEGRITR